MSLRSIFEFFALFGLALEFLLYFSLDLSFFGLWENIRLSRIFILFSIIIFICLVFSLDGKLRLLPISLYLYPTYVIFSSSANAIFGSTEYFDLMAKENGYNVSSFNFFISDIVILIYIFIFYYLIALQVFSREINLFKFSRLLKFFFIVSVSVGVVNLIFSIWEIQLISRQLNYATKTFIGIRFFGLFGEPRDAAGALIFYSFVMVTINWWRGRPTSTMFLIFILVLLIFTQSGSLLFALPIWLMLTTLYSPLVFSKNKGLFFSGFIFISIILFGLLMFSDRIILYLDDIRLYLITRDEGDITYHLGTQFDNLYPFFVFYDALRDLDVLRFLFGYGFPASTFMKLTGDSYTLTYVTGELPRLLMNHGVVGVFLWMVFVLTPLRMLIRLARPDPTFGMVIFLYLGIVAISLIHRNHLIYIAACFVLGLIPFVSTQLKK